MLDANLIITFRERYGNVPCVMGTDSPHNGPLVRGYNVLFVGKLEKAVEQTVESHVIWNAMTIMWRNCM